MSNEDRKWHVLYTMPRWEKKIYASLLRKGLEVWCPLQKVERQWSDRKKVVEEPIFKSYLFIRINDQEKAVTLHTEGILNFVHYLGKPAIVRDEEIETIKAYLHEKDVKLSLLSKEVFEADTKIKVTQGVFMDQTGTVIKALGRNKIYVSLETIGHVLIVEFPAQHLQVIR